MKLNVQFNHPLTPRCDEKSIYHLRLQAKNLPDFDYEPGDWLLIQSANTDALVNAVMDALQIDGREQVTLRRIGVVSAFKALKHHLELTQLNPAILNKLQRQFGFERWADRSAMMDFAKGRDILDLIAEVAQAKGLGVALIAMLSPLAPRYYSIASSRALVGNDTVDVVYREVVYARNDRIRLGVCTHQLASLNVGDVIEASFSFNRAFKLPKNTCAPIYMLGAGTGIAPFLGFCQQRFSDNKRAKDGQTTLYFGETHAATNYLFESQLTTWQAENGLILKTAFSRDQADKIYVQSRLWEDRQAVWKALSQQGAHLYVCGDKDKLGRAVEGVLLKIFEEVGGVDDAPATLAELRKAGQVQMDVY